MLAEVAQPPGRRAAWADRLSEFIRATEALAASPTDHCITPPRVHPIQKTPAELVFRPLAIFTPHDRVLIGLTAKYLRTVFDPIFSPQSYAFRAPSNGKSPPRHHDAFSALLNYRASLAPRTLWIAECDISAFYDTVSHSIAARAFERAVQDVEARGGEVDPRAHAIFGAYLESYSFSRTARPAAERYFTEKRLNGAKLKWPEAQLANYWNSVDSVRIGIPQGGAISCVIANLVLHEADSAVIGSRTAGDPDLFYARYCDDIILAHPSKRACEAALNRYLGALEALALPYHEPTAVPYSAEHWKAKSKSPYKWAPAQSGGVPWVAFVGYQLRHDGLTRIRPSSLEKHAQKLVSETSAAIAAIAKRGWISRNSRATVEAKVAGRLVSLSTGRVPLGLHRSLRGTYCWTDGFGVIRESNYVASQLRRLDRVRARQLARLRRRLRKLRSTADKTSAVRRRTTPYRGYPFSYAYQFTPPTPPGQAANSPAAPNVPEEAGRSDPA